MFKDLPLLQSIIFCTFLCAAWHFISLGLCVKLDISHFDYNKSIYKIKKFENNGRFYQKHFKINKWKDKLPQHIAEDGFSKASISSTSPEYFETFIMETCRAGWCHLVNCFYIIIALFLSPNAVGLTLGILTIIVNIPFIMIQRYNRARLLRVLHRIKKEAKTINAEELQKV